MQTPDQIFDIKISLLAIQPQIWRRLLLPSRITLPKLHLVLQAAMGWTNSHLHHFVIGDNRYGEINPDWDGDVMDERRRKLHQFLHEPFDKLTYEYDFGDGWEHDLILEDSFQATPRQVFPVCIDGKRACPPEDVGGIYGYAEFLNSIRDSTDPDHERKVTWIGGYFDPEYFNIHETNVLLGRYFPRGA